MGGRREKGKGEERAQPFGESWTLALPHALLDSFSERPSGSTGRAHNTLGLTWGKNKRKPEGNRFGKLQVTEDRGLTQASFLNLDCNKNR